MFKVGGQINEGSVDYIVEVCSFVGNNGPVWRPWKTSSFCQLGLDKTGEPVSGEKWAKFSGRLGVKQHNSMDSATYLNGDGLDALDWAYVKLVSWAAAVLDKIPGSLLEGNGPSGPGGRSWALPPPASATLFDGTIRMIQACDNLGEGPGAVLWEAGRFLTADRAQVLQGWNNDSHLGMIMYSLDDKWQINKVVHIDNVGQGPSAVAWMKGRFVPGDTQQIVQCWNNDSSLGMNLYDFSRLIDNTGGPATLQSAWSSPNMNEGSGGVKWLAGDFVGNNLCQIIQCWNNGNLGMILYGWCNTTQNEQMQQIWKNGDLGQGPGFITMLTGDFDGSGTKQIAQCWDNGNLAIIYYKADISGQVSSFSVNTDLGEGPGAVHWAVGDFDGDGSDEIIQCWDNGNLGMIMYKLSTSGEFESTWSNPDMGQGPGAIQWLVGDFLGSGKKQLIQCWMYEGSLGMILYGSDGNGGITTLWSNSNLGTYLFPNLPIGFLADDFRGNGKTEIILLSTHINALGMTAFGTV